MSVRKYGFIHSLKEAVFLLTDKCDVDQALQEKFIGQIFRGNL
jgi:hypothetical protein